MTTHGIGGLMTDWKTERPDVLMGGLDIAYAFRPDGGVVELAGGMPLHLGANHPTANTVRAMRGSIERDAGGIGGRTPSGREVGRVSDFGRTWRLYRAADSETLDALMKNQRGIRPARPDGLTGR